jgi:HEPN domain-containing protein
MGANMYGVFRTQHDMFRRVHNMYPHTHDYYSIWFNLSAAFFKSEKTTGVIKLKTHYLISNHFMKYYDN